MASFRIRTPAEYLKLLWRRRYFVLLPSVVVASALGYAIYKLPNVYESRTTVIVDPPKVSSNYVQPVNQIDLNSRLNSIQKQVTSRTELQRLINRYGLYPELMARNTPIELVIDEMNRFIFVQPYSASSGIYAFQISYRGPDPRTIRDVTAELAARFIDANSDETRRQVYTTIDLLEGRINEVKTELEKIEADRAGFLVSNPDAVTGQEQNMLGQMNSLSMIRQSQQNSIDSLRSQITTSEQVLANMKTQDNVEPEAPVTAGQIEGQLRAKRAEYEAQVRQLLVTYTEKLPEVIKLRVQIESINRELDDLKTKTEQERQNKRAAKTANPQIAQLEIKLSADRSELVRKNGELEQTNRQLTELQSRLRNSPILATEATKIERDYNTLRKRYEDLLSMRDNARFGAKVINDFSGETFRMADPANLPEAPASPKRSMLYPMALAIGLLSGLIAAASVEARALMTIRDSRDVTHYTQLPLLVTVPKIVTESELRRQPILNAAKVFGIVVLIPLAAFLLYQGIKISRLLSMVTGSY
jgi:polysaccharide chain length determinant protein (PEP-CTERM system associated)